MNEPTTYTASVKVMRSHDYCHFEVALGTTEQLDAEGVDAMRKEAARLTDKAVEQYKLMKDALRRAEELDYDRRRLKQRFATFQAKPEAEWSPTQKAVAKKLRDDAYWQRRTQHSYDDGAWEDEYADVEDRYDNDDETKDASIPF